MKRIVMLICLAGLCTIDTLLVFGLAWQEMYARTRHAMPATPPPAYVVEEREALAPTSWSNTLAGTPCTEVVSDPVDNSGAILRPGYIVRRWDWVKK